MSHSSDDNFLAQILEAEAKAAKDIEKAKVKAQQDLEAFASKAADARSAKLDDQREKAKDTLKERQVKAKKMYEDMVAEGEKEAHLLNQEVDRKIEKLIPQAQSYFISDILA